MWPNRQETVTLVTFTEKILNGKLHSLCCVCNLEACKSVCHNSTHLFKNEYQTLTSFAILNFSLYSATDEKAGLLSWEHENILLLTSEFSQT